MHRNSKKNIIRIFPHYINLFSWGNTFSIIEIRGNIGFDIKILNSFTTFQSNIKAKSEIILEFIYTDLT